MCRKGRNNYWVDITLSNESTFSIRCAPQVCWVPVAIICTCNFTFQDCNFSYCCCNELQPLLLLYARRLFHRGVLITNTKRSLLLAVFSSKCFCTHQLRTVSYWNNFVSQLYFAFLQHPIPVFELYQCDNASQRLTFL